MGRRLSSLLLIVAVGAVTLLAALMPVSAGAIGYTYSSPSPGVVDVAAPPLASDNDRGFFYSRTGSIYTDSSACVTASGMSPAQPGLAFRITDSRSVMTAVTVTENIFGSSSSPGYNEFNVHTWDTSRSPPYSLVGQVRIKAISSSPQPEPLNLCAELTNDLVQFVVWTSGPRPAWSDPTRGASVILPSSAPTSGHTGFFAGHIPPGTSAVFSHLTVDGAVANPLTCCVAIQSASSPIGG